MCPVCQSTETEWIQASGRGRIYSWVVVTHPVDPVLVDQVPYAVAMIDLEEERASSAMSPGARLTRSLRKWR